MLFFLISLLIVGMLFTYHFSGDLPYIFLSLAAPLIGILFYAINIILLLLLRVPITLNTIWILLGVEGTALLLNLIRFRKTILFSTKLVLSDIIVVISIVMIGLFFFKNNYSYASYDSFYMIIMAQNILETGLSKFYFASPSGMGLFAPILQTIGLLFKFEYTWFIQPLISVLFFSFFIFFGMKVAEKYKISPWAKVGIILSTIAVLLSSNLILVFTTYIHSNFDSGIFLFISFMSLISYFENNKNGWLIFTTIFLIGFGLVRLENAIFACVMILLILADGKIEANKLISTFAPFLIFQSIWFLTIYSLHTDSFTDQLRPNVILAVTAGYIAVLTLLCLNKNHNIKALITKYVYRFLPYILVVVFGVLLLVNWYLTTNNLIVFLENLFVYGNWWLFWAFISIISIFIFLYSPKIDHERIYLYLIIIFFEQIFILGGLREPYHLSWTDSANRMVIHIVPILLIFLLQKIFSWINKSDLKVISNSEVQQGEQSNLNRSY